VSATSTLAAAKTAAIGAAAVATAAAAGTLIGQGLRGLWTLCWDPVCNATSLNVGNIYAPPTQAQLDALLPTLTSAGAGVSLTAADFAAAGSAGQLAADFIETGAALFIGAAQGAAAATAGNDPQVLQAVADLQPQLADYRATIESFSALLQSSGLPSPVADFNTAVQQFDAAAQQSAAVCDTAQGDDCAALAAAFADASASLHSISNQLSSLSYPPLVGPGGVFPDLTVAGFQTFINDTTVLGSAALPPQEIALADFLLVEADVFFPGMSSFGPALAEYDAAGGASAGELSLFDPITNSLSFDALLFGSATVLSSPTGYWLNIDLEQSPVTIEARAAVPEPSAVAVFAIVGTLLGLASVCRRRYRRQGWATRHA
jgi:hypothetical protein